MANVVDASLHLLDRQILDRDGVPVGKVDDLELEIRGDGAPVVAAILCGPSALGPRLGGRLGVWWLAIGRRLRPESHADPVRISFGTVTELDSAVHLAISVAEAGTDRLEIWCRTKVVERLPGSDHATGSS